MKEMPGWAFMISIIAVVSLTIAIPYLIAAKDAQRPALQSVPVTLTLPSGTTLSSLQEGTVKEIIDGDSMNVIIDGKTTGIRLYGVDTPAAGQRCFREAEDRTMKLVGKKVLLLPDTQEKDKNNIALRYVFTPEGVSIDATLVAEGFGHASSVDGQYRSQIAGYETQAQEAKRGCLWK
jgi:micrococcal nuclease